VSIICKSNHHGTVSDKHGNFAVQLDNNLDSIEFTSLGYYSRTVKVTGSELLIKLAPLYTGLDEIVISGNREIQKRSEVPLSIGLISKETINETKADRLDQLVNKVPGVYMADLGNEQHSMGVRQPIGTKNLFLYLEDGIPIRTVGDFNHNALIEINQASLQRIEVIKGPASSLYGSEAVGGAINFITQSPSTSLTGKVQIEAASNGYYRSDFNVSNSYKKIGVYFGGYYADQRQPVNEHNDFNKLALTFRADYYINASSKVTAVADKIDYKTDQKGGLDSLLFFTKNYNSFYRFTYRKVNAFRLRTTWTNEWDVDNKTSLTFFYRNSTIGQNPFYSISNIAGNSLKAKGQINEDGFKSYGAVLQHSKRMNAIKSNLITGISFDFSPATYNARFIDIDKDLQGVYVNYHSEDSLLTNYQVDLINSALYAQFEYSPVTKLKLLLAARYDRLDYKFDNHLLPGAFTGAADERNHFSNFSPKIGLIYKITKNMGGYFNYSKGFAPPNISDLYTGVKVPFLKAADYQNFEIGSWISFDSGKGYLEFSLYNMDGKNEIVSVRQADGSYLNENTGKTNHWGVETNIRYNPVKNVTFRLSGAYSRHKYVYYLQQGKEFSGNTMPQAPEFAYNAGIDYKPDFLKNFRIGIELQGMSKYYTDPQNINMYPGFIIFNLRTAYIIRDFELWVNCLNITDKLYAVTVEKNVFGTTYRPGQLRTFNIGFAFNLKNNLKKRK
jgi:outer membrane receptor protein involved in Fe transport